jgi:NAD(P)-dependent dehydrogenase (short-subunit alcohol dehydrogenase family)
VSFTGHKAVAVKTEVAALIEQTVSSFNRLDAMVNNAGRLSPAVETNDAGGAAFGRVNAINLRPVWNYMKYELRW